MTAPKPAARMGRPPADPPIKQVMVYLDTESHARAETLGSGNVSRGIREAIAAAWKRYARREPAQPG